MKNPFKAFFEKKSSGFETYLGLFLKEQDGALFYLEQKGNEIKIVKREKFIFTDGWTHLAEDVDEVLNRLETATGKSPEQTIFFVYSHLNSSRSVA